MTDPLSASWNKNKYTSIFDIDPIASNYRNLVDQQLAGLDQLTIQNYNSLLTKFPNQSKDYLLSAAKIGLNANTKGIEKLSANDGIAQLKQDLINVDNIKSQADKDKGFHEGIYGVLKGTTRFGFAALQAPYQYITNVGRNLYAKGKGEISTTELINNISLSELIGEETNLGQLLRATGGLVTGKGPVDTGSGFFVSPESKVGAAQAKAMSSYGRINGKSFTIGRNLMNSLGADPNSTPYRVMSGIVDATLAVGTDPSLWLGPGSVTKVIKGGKELQVAKTAAQAVEDAKQAAKIADIKSIVKQDKQTVKERVGTEKKIRRNIDNTYMKAERDLVKKEQSKSNANIKRLGKALTTGIGRLEKTQGDPAVIETISDVNIGDFVMKNLAEKKSQGVIDQIAQLDADYINTGRAFTGIYMEELPQAGKLSFGAFDNGEYIVTAAKDKDLDIYDIAKTYKDATADEIADEMQRRGNFWDALKLELNRPDITDELKFALTKYITKGANGSDAFKSSIDDLVSNQGTESVSTLLNRAVATKNDELVIAVTDAIENTWVADGYANIRAINNGIGGVVIKNADAIGARRVGITDTLTAISGKAEMGSSLGAKLVESIKNADQEVADARNALEAAQAARAGIDGKLKEIEILRDYAAADPDLVKQLLNDPENIGIAKLMDLEMDIADNQYLKEFYRSEVGLIDGFGGAVKGDLNKAATYLLGKNFSRIAEVVANEKDFSRLHRLFGRKLDVEMTKELVDATTVDEVLSIFLKHLAAPTSDPKVFRSLTLKGEAAKLGNSPLFKVSPRLAEKAISQVERIERGFGRYFSRSTVLPLDDLDRLVNGMEDWMSSAGLDEDIITNTVNRIVAAPTPQIRSAVVFQEFEKAHVEIARKLDPLDDNLAKEIAEAFRIRAEDDAIIKKYVPEKLAYNEQVSLDGVMINGQRTTHTFAGDQAIFEYQFLDDVIRLPDSKDIKLLIKQYQDQKAVYGARKAITVFSNEFGDRWRTGQLAFRAAYIMRNIGEMQFRQYFSGHDSLFNHPLGYLAMIAGSEEGGKVRQLLGRIAKYNNDVLGNKLVGKDAEVNAGLSEAVEEHFKLLMKDYNSGDPRFAFVGKIYEAIGTESDRFHLGLSHTLIRAHTDKIIPMVARALLDGQEDELVRLLIQGKGDKFAGVLESLIQGGRNGVGKAEFAKIFLRDSSNKGSLKNPRYDLSPENFIPENVKVYLFDPTSTGSVARYINNVAGTGPRSVDIKTLLADGRAIVNGKKIEIPSYKKAKSLDEMKENEFRNSLRKIFPSDEMTGSTVIAPRDKRMGAQNMFFLTKATDKFFEISTKIENVVNFAPEFRMSYWDYVGRYVNMVNDDALEALLKNAEKSLEPLTIGGKSISLRRQPTLRAIKKEISARKKGKSVTNGISLETMNSMAAQKAAKYTKGLFYNAAEQRQYANAMRLVFPFAQAQFNTIYKWSQLLKDNPTQFYKIGRAYNALTQEGSSAIYDITGTKYEENQGFFYKDEFGETRFRYPLAGSVIGAMAGKNIDTAQALQITAPVQSLNLAFGAVNPLVPGIGPIGQITYAATGRSKAFGPGWDAMRQIIFPFGEPKDAGSFVLPSWLNKTFLSIVNNDTQVERGVKDWASYLASTGKYGDNPLADDAQRNEIFNDARGLSRWTGLFTAFFQSIAPATPSQEVFAKDKNGSLRTQTALYSAYEQISKKYPGDYFGAIGEFSDTFGIKNLLPILAGSTRSVRGTGDAWSFLNNNPDMADKYSTKSGDIVPYFFPGGEAATAYYNWQKATGRRRNLRPEELEQYAENIVYQMAKSQISEEQATMGYTDVWYTDEVIRLNEQFGGNAPVMSVDIGSVEEKIANIGKALLEPAFEQSPIYKETSQFYAAYKNLEQYLQEVRTTATPGIGSGFWLAKEEAKKLDLLATQLMINNPAFARMYYGVFASKLKVEE
jgi:hypothetical protein